MRIMRILFTRESNFREYGGPQTIGRVCIELVAISILSELGNITVSKQHQRVKNENVIII